MQKVTVTVAPGATFWSDNKLYEAGETLDVAQYDANRGKYHGLFVR